MKKQRPDINLLKEKQVEFILKSSEYASLLQELTQEISEKCNDMSLSEASIATVFEFKLIKFITDIFHQEIIPAKEVSIETERHIAKGRIDSKIGAVILEFKKPAVLRSTSKQQDATKQLNDYLKSLTNKQKGVFVGVITDGVRCQIVRYSDNLVSTQPYRMLDPEDINTIIKSILLLNETALSPENLIKDFCLPIGNNLVIDLTRELFSILTNQMTPKTQMLFTEWQEIFKLAHDDISKQTAILDRKSALEDVIGQSLTDNINEYKALYSLQTTYAIITKIIAYKVISKKMFDKNLIVFADLAVANTDSLQLQLERLEDGEIFRDYGFGNLLEGDFFSWYAAAKQWTTNLGTHIKKIFLVLSKYENNDVIDKYSTIQDLFKDLYLQIMPAKVRHCLGEYYTPAWLADHVISTALEMLPSKKNWRGLDPCAGSGTFVTVMIRHVVLELSNQSEEVILENILRRIKAIDLNPLAVLSARINYFINIFPYLRSGQGVEIPVYLGDASYVPEKVTIDGIACLRYSLKTTQGNIEIEIPRDTVKDTNLFSHEMTALENDIHAQDEDAVYSRLIQLVPYKQRKKTIEERISILARQFVDLERKDWNGIWARIVTNFLTTANIGRFDIIAGNPPWVDWKNLPAGYREKITSLCISRELFSGDGITGGINLNICALISNVAAQNWLANKGILAFLMPQTILFQKTYDGYRKLIQDNGNELFFQKFVDWTKAGHPFFPVQHKFFTYYIGHTEKNYSTGIPVEIMQKDRNAQLSNFSAVEEFAKIEKIFKISKTLMIHASTESTSFSYANNSDELESFQRLAGHPDYVCRQGVEFYPQEVFLFEYDPQLPTTSGCVGVSIFQTKKSKYKVPRQSYLLEKKFLHPIVRGKEVSKFHIELSGLLVPFTYTSNDMRAPIPFAQLRKQSSRLANYLFGLKGILDNQTPYNQKIIGDKNNTEFYAIARVGTYSFAKHFVVLRDNTKWGAAVVSTLKTPWGENKMPVFQKHAVTISQDLSGRYISENEAHFICGILNSNVVEKYILQTSDSRSFKIRIPVVIPLFNPNDKTHKGISMLSLNAHNLYNNETEIAKIRQQLDKLYLGMLDKRV